METSFSGNLNQRKKINSGEYPETEFLKAFAEMARRVWLDLRSETPLSQVRRLPSETPKICNICLASFSLIGSPPPFSNSVNLKCSLPRFNYHKAIAELKKNRVKKQRPEMVVNSGEPTTEPWFKPKKGSVIPAKRRSVKKMMFDSMVQSVASLFQSFSFCFCGSSDMKQSNK
ncbi:unnamed protein product [Ilex paraguariensis]|uniref:Uncharacterized protein n=1 Tax=Ilex paraguariensis TaxID=185542 RepID=A0ABC8U962_9AQUA